MRKMREAVRLGAIAALLVAGSCAAPTNPGAVSDPEANHPISVQPNYKAVKLPYSAANQGLLPDDSVRLTAFVQDYLTRGNGAISISAPAGPGAASTIHYFGERLASMGVPRTSILVGTHAVANGDSRVELGFVGYVASTAPCGDWSMDAADDWTNNPSPDFGCSVQHNVAAEIADPRDLVAPRPMDAADATRRGTIMGKYEKGDTTQASKTQDQSGNVSDVGSSN